MKNITNWYFFFYFATTQILKLIKTLGKKKLRVIQNTRMPNFLNYTLSLLLLVQKLILKKGSTKG